MSVLYAVLAFLMRLCYGLTGNYGVAIILFTLISKVLLFPVSLWVHKGALKVVALQAPLNRIKAQYFGDKDAIAEKQADLYKEAHYNPLSSVIPTAIQIIILIGLIHVIRSDLDAGTVNPLFAGLKLDTTPVQTGGIYYVLPFAAGMSAVLLSLAQNRLNVLQKEQTLSGKIGSSAFSVGLSLYLGFFVPCGVIVYWIASNLLSVPQQLVLNRAMPPEKHVDFAELERSKTDLQQLGAVGKGASRLSREERRRERADYKRFFSVVNKHVVFYSEASGFYKYYQGYIDYLLQHTAISIHYITGDPADRIFELAKENERIKPYFIGERLLITLMMKLEAQIVLMTMPELDKYHIKRSYVDKDIEYIYLWHGISSLNMMRAGSVDAFDTVFSLGKFMDGEIRATEAFRHTKEKTLVPAGYPLLDDMIADYRAHPPEENRVKTILIAPSWATGNIMDNGLDVILSCLKETAYRVVVRPHPQYVRHNPERCDVLKEQYRNVSNVEIQTDFSSNETVFGADLLITDWSGISTEYAFTTLRPVLFVNTPRKNVNPEYERLGIDCFFFRIRDKIGRSVAVEELDGICEVVDELMDNPAYRERILEIREHELYGVGESARIGGEYIISQLLKRQKTHAKEEAS